MRCIEGYVIEWAKYRVTDRLMTDRFLADAMTGVRETNAAVQ